MADGLSHIAYRISWIVASVILAGCGAAPDVQPSPTPTATQFPIPTHTSTPTLTPTATPAPLWTVAPRSVKSDLRTALLARDILFTPPDDPACALPCWQGLSIGVSGREDIQRVLDRVFAFEGTLDFFRAEPQMAGLEAGDQFEGYQTTGYAWTYPGGDFPALVLTVVVDEADGRLAGLAFENLGAAAFNRAVGYQAVRIYTPAGIARQLGPPDRVYGEIRFGYVERNATINIPLELVYERGLSFFFYYSLRRVGRVTFDDWCLDRRPDTSRYAITAPLGIPESQADPVQQAWVFAQIQGYFDADTAHAARLLPEDFARAVGEPRPCFRLDYANQKYSLTTGP